MDHTKNRISIRPAAPNDLSEVYKLMCALENDNLEPKGFAAVFQRNLDSLNCLYCVAAVENQIIGFISLQVQELLHHCGEVGEIQEFYVEKNHRGQGVGRMLMDKVIAYALDRNLKSLEVTSNKRRTENIAVYEHLGFVLSHNKFTIDYSDATE